MDDLALIERLLHLKAKLRRNERMQKIALIIQAIFCNDGLFVVSTALGEWEMSAISLGDRLKTLRESCGLNQTELARKAGLTQAAISQIEDGKRVPSLQSLQKLASELGMTVDSLIGDTANATSVTSKKECAIAGLTAKLKHKSISVDEIIALTQYFDARLKGG